ncbi:MAG TPA: matrixin family metalloprotease [Thermoanaerobaculia bacterium]|nr:matrixin family metalloprotease [Thermoanaerobaculia bacterium]
MQAIDPAPTFGSRFRAAWLLLAAGLTLAASPAHAYRMIQNDSTGRVTSGSLVTCSDAGGFTHWETRSIGWWHNTAGQGSGKATALQNALATWTSVTTADHVLSYLGTTAAGFVTDGQNSIGWGTGNGCSGSCLALTALVLQPGQVIVESDITFNSDHSWSTSGAQYDTEAVAAHELGHALGIHHTELTGTPRPTMYASYFGSGGRSLENDDRSAIACSENRYCTQYELEGSGFLFGGRLWADLYWGRLCIPTADVDVFRDGVKILTTTNDGYHNDRFYSSATSANYWVCEAGSTTWYDSDTCTNVVTVSF